jgi:hypothetical protein
MTTLQRTSPLGVDDPILIRCPKCQKLTQPNRPLDDDFSQEVARITLEHDCPNHLWPEVIEA